MPRPNKNKNDYYVYILFCSAAQPFYVGKGRGARSSSHEQAAKKLPHAFPMPLKDKIIKDMLVRGLSIPVIHVAENLSEEVALATETSFIEAIGAIPNGPLVNAYHPGAKTLYVEDDNGSLGTLPRVSILEDGMASTLARFHERGDYGFDVGDRRRRKRQTSHSFKGLVR